MDCGYGTTEFPLDPLILVHFHEIEDSVKANSSRRRAEVSSSTQSDYVVFRGGYMCSPPSGPPDDWEKHSIIGIWRSAHPATRTPAAHQTLRLDHVRSTFEYFEINENGRVGSLQFSHWKLSPFLVMLLWHQPMASELIN